MLFTEAEPLGRAHEIGERFDSHLLHDVSAVQFDVLLPGAEVAGDLFVELAGDDLRHDLALARRSAATMSARISRTSATSGGSWTSSSCAAWALLRMMPSG